ncbi:hypothetical protein QF035_001356 [Streptomyces umbrinus]|uniref:Uncharacterized protein n=1 Tax=Streptomyces umbrinus TaxID=67370 RepID=A0ABU0SJR0_9ACTN|nr:hypothetical protein [Streptomyces umbrinus]
MAEVRSPSYAAALARTVISRTSFGRHTITRTGRG